MPFKLASPGWSLLQYRTDGATDMTAWNKRCSVVAKRECLTVCGTVDELEYKSPEEVQRPYFAAFVSEDDKYIAKKMYLKKIEKT